MRDIEGVLRDYRHGNFEVRLNLFLFHRRLRSEFNEIEKEESPSINGDKRRYGLYLKSKQRPLFPFGIVKKRDQPSG